MIGISKNQVSSSWDPPIISCTYLGKKITDLTEKSDLCPAVVIGGTVGGFLGGLAGIPGGPGGVFLGAAFGIPIGAGIGAAFASSDCCAPETINDKKSKESIPSTTPIMSTEVDPSLSHPICPITQLPIIEGVNTPTGHTFEKAALVQWISISGTDPLTKESLTKENLVKHETFNLNYSKKYVQILNEKKERVSENSLMSKYDQLIKDVKDAAFYIYTQKTNFLFEKLKKNEITYEEFDRKNRHLSEKYIKF